MTRKQAVQFLLNSPYKLGQLVGFTRLTELHNGWIIDMVRGREDKTLQAHRGSYKTTCVSLALAVLLILCPNDRIMFLRKTDDDIKEILDQVRKILQSPHMQYFTQCIYGVDLQFTASNTSEISTNLTSGARGTAQLFAMGVGGSLTGKHFDKIFTDDIVNVKDRFSRAEREHTKIIYQELQNIKNRGGRIYNTGTPWHKEDAFVLMPNIERYDCYSTGLIDADELNNIRESMTASLFAANYELRHIAAEDVIFSNPQTGADPALCEQGDGHIDAAYSGQDYTAFTICKKRGGKYYIYGKLWRKHVDECTEEIIHLRKRFMAGRIYCEENTDKGYLAKDLRKRGERVVTYFESMNKFVKISTYLKAEWKNIIFVMGTDEAYIDQICDYNEDADHDDAPDSLASMVRRLWGKQDKEYHSILE